MNKIYRHATQEKVIVWGGEAKCYSALYLLVTDQNYLHTSPLRGKGPLLRSWCERSMVKLLRTFTGELIHRTDTFEVFFSVLCRKGPRSCDW